MRWTDWRFLANSEGWADDDLDWTGPAVYELAVAGPRGGQQQVVYVGETAGESVRLAAYGSGRSHIEWLIDDAIRKGWTIWYHASARPTKTAAKATQDSLLKKHYYAWNTVGQRRFKSPQWRQHDT